MEHRMGSWLFRQRSQPFADNGRTPMSRNGTCPRMTSAGGPRHGPPNSLQQSDLRPFCLVRYVWLCFCFLGSHMKRPSRTPDTRRKAVWGPGRTSAAAALLFLGLATSAMAEGRHSRTVPQTPAGVPGNNVAHYKLDGEVTERAHHGHPLGRTSV